MANGKELLNELDFDKKIKTKPDRELLEFVAEQVYSICNRCANEEKRIDGLATSIATLDDKIDSRIFRITMVLVGLVVGGGGGFGLVKLIAG